jgi:Holliday junction resolvase RusA-like endonuclease
METYTGPLWVPGHPVPKGSMKCITPHVGGRHAVLVPDKRTDPDGWATKVPAVLALRAPKLVRDPVTGPVELVVDFHLKKAPTTKFRDAPIGHGMGDLDKLTRMIGDAVTTTDDHAGLVDDDSRICKIVAEKIYSPTGKEGASIELRPYVPPTEMSVGTMPVRVQVGRTNALVGSITSARDLPRLLRAVADEMERRNDVNV